MGRPKTLNGGFPYEKTLEALFQITGTDKKNALAEKLGVGPGAITRARTDKHFSSELILQFALRHGLSMDQLMAMVFEGRKKEQEANQEKTDGAEVKKEAVSVLPESLAIPNLRRIPKRSIITASTELDKEWVSAHFGEHWNQLAVYMMDSDNMAPLIQPGDFLLIDAAVKSIDGSGVYAFRTEDGDVVFYRVHKRFDGDIDIFSENRSYPGEHINPKRIPEVAGRVVKILKDPY